MRATKKTRGVLISGPFTPIMFDVQDSRAYQVLPGNASKLYGYMVRAARTVAYKLGAATEDLVDFDFTYSEAKKRGFSESTFKKAIKELWAVGFISVIAIGGKTASEARGRMPSKYRLTSLWKTFGSHWENRTKLEADPWAKLSEPKSGDNGRW